MGIYSKKILDVVDVTEERTIKDRETKNVRWKTIEYKTVKTAILECGHMMPLISIKTNPMPERILCRYCQYPGRSRNIK